MTVYASAGKRSRGRLSRQGPGVLRWLVYDAGKTHARRLAPDHGYYASVKDRIDGKRATLAQAASWFAAPCTSWTSSARGALAWTSDQPTDAGAAGATPIPMRTRPAPAIALSTPTGPAVRASTGRACKD